MFFLTRTEADGWTKQIERGVAPIANSKTADFSNLKEAYSTNCERLDAWKLSLAIQRQMNASGGLAGSRRMVLITETGIWPSSEDWHLYYLLRRSQGDWRRVDEAPGHAFLAHEQADFLTWLSMFFRFGWGGILVGNSDSTSYSFNHDGALNIFVHQGDSQVEEYFAPLNMALRRHK